MCTARLPVINWTDAPADYNGLVRFAERRNLFSARVPSHFKRSLLPLMRTPRLQVVDWTDARADFNALVRFAERRSLISARVPAHFKRSLQTWRPDLRLCRYLVRQTRFYLLCDCPFYIFELVPYTVFCFVGPRFYSPSGNQSSCSYLWINKCIYWFCQRSP
jgi:hypothetical protein